MTSKPLALYLHIPFCASKCPYCDFYSGRYPAETRARYVEALKEELETGFRSRAFLPPDVYSRPLSSVYFGGGTPSLLGAEPLTDLLNAARRRFTVLPDAEITLEANPSLEEPEAFFAALAESGVNRVSLGLQSAVDAERKKLGRRAGRADAERCVRAAYEAGITNVSLDVMLGIPGQTPASLNETLSFAANLGVPHLSCYLLKIEPGTPFHKLRDKLDLPDDDASADFYLQTCAFLKARGYRHYEVSNFCRDGLVGRHNMTYWADGEYLGLGPGAHSFLNGTRFFQPPDLDSFLARVPAEFEGAGGDEAERLMLRLRTDLGAPLTSFPDKTAAIAAMERNGLVTVRDGQLCLTDKGFLVSNAVLAELL
jgi:oxygen-independent coproporphyrinogen-3 oxidase